MGRRSRNLKNNICKVVKSAGIRLMEDFEVIPMGEGRNKSHRVGDGDRGRGRRKYWSGRQVGEGRNPFANLTTAYYRGVNRINAKSTPSERR